MKRFKQVILIALFVIGLGLALGAVGPHIYADASTQTACNAISGDHGCSSTGPSITKIVRVAIKIFSIVVGVAAVIMIIIGGFKYITSNGDSNAISSAKQTIIYAIVGLVIVAMAQFIVQFVLGRVK